MARKLLHNHQPGRSFPRNRVFLVLLISVFFAPTITSCSKSVCPAYSNNVDGKVKRKRKKKKNRRRQEGMDKNIYKWGR